MCSEMPLYEMDFNSHAHNRLFPFFSNLYSVIEIPIVLISKGIKPLKALIRSKLTQFNSDTNCATE